MNLVSGNPYWLIKSGLPFNYPSIEEDIETDVAIIGGGISGALAAWYLFKAGVDCVIIDRRSIGLGSTCASTSLLQYEIDTALCELIKISGEKKAVTAFKLCENAIDKIGDIAQKVGCSDFEFKESLYYAAHKKDIPFLKREFQARKNAGFEVMLLEEAEVREQYGFKAPAAILSLSGAQTDAYSLTHAIFQFIKKSGVGIYDRSPVTSIAHKQRSVVLTIQNGKRVTAKKLIYANGYEAVQYINQKIVNLQSTYASISEQCNSSINFWKDEVMIWNTDDPYLYMRTTPDRRIIIGGRDELFYDDARRDRLLTRKSMQLKKDFEKLFPSIEFKQEFNWTGTFGSTKDGLPFIGKYKKLPNSYFALGFGGNGITFGQVAAEMITTLITKGESKYSNIFSFERQARI